MLRYIESRHGLVALYDIRPGNGAGPFLQPRSPHGALGRLKLAEVGHVTRDSDTSHLAGWRPPQYVKGILRRPPPQLVSHTQSKLGIMLI